MKRIVILFIIFSLLLCVTACNKPSDQEKQSDVVSSEDITENNTEPMVETIALDIREYSDFLLFALKGELDPDKYQNAELYLSHFKFDAETFVDVKEIFKLPDAESKGWEEQIIIEQRNEYSYLAYSTEDQKKEHQIIVGRRDAALGDMTYNESTVVIEQISDMSDKDGSFVYKNDKFDICYYKDEGRYMFFALYSNDLMIIFHFENEGLSQTQIAEKYDTIISNLFDNNNETVEKALSDLYSSVYELNK